MAKKEAFDGQWVDIFSVGNHTDDSGTPREIDLTFLEQTAANFLPDQHEPPAVIGHPKTDAPAYGWTCALRVNGDMLQARFCDVDPAFEQLVREGKFKKRSASFYMDARTAPAGRVPQLRHVGFLGAQPPAVKGLREIKFNEGDALTFDFSEGERMGETEDKRTVGEQIADFFREKFGSKESKTEGVSFGESDVKKLVADAMTSVETKFTEEITKRDTLIENLKTQVGQQSGSATRAELISFCERLGHGKFLPAFKKMGVVDFMEVLATLPDKKVSVISFTEEGGKEVEKAVEITPLQFFQNFLNALPAYVEFGEKFGDIKVTGSSVEISDPAEMEKLRAGMGTKKTEGGAK
ncbi:MAG: hypothetical protein WCD76_08400 [Pyrinomonadaceae bacterium]